jgi:hypothetical protein
MSIAIDLAICTSDKNGFSESTGTTRITSQEDRCFTDRVISNRANCFRSRRLSSIPEPSSSDEADQESRLDGIFKTLAGGHPGARVQFEAPANQPRVKFDDLPKIAQPEEAEAVPKYKCDHEKMVEQMRTARKYAAYIFVWISQF